MKSTTQWSICLAILLSIGLVAGCGGGASEEEAKQAAFQENFEIVKASYETLKEIRSNLAQATETVSEIEAIAEKKRTDEQKAQLAEAAATVDSAGSQIEDAYGTLQENLAQFLNEALNEAPQSELTAEALRIYSEEAILGAYEKVEKAGDYAKAIDQVLVAKSYYEAVNLTPYPPLDETVAELQDWRFITPERLAAVKKGMTRDEVKAVAGVPYYGNIQEDTDKDVETWLYKNAEGGASAVYFKIKTGKVYETKADAVKTRVVE